MGIRPASFFCPCPRGLEALLRDELIALGAAEARVAPGGVACSGPFSLAWKINLWSRLASRVLWQLKQAPYRSEDDVYRAALTIDWPELFDVDRTFLVRVEAVQSPLRSLDFITLRIKDAVCDRFRRASARRPDVNTRQPDARVHAFLSRDTVTFYLDTSGAALFQRGWRLAANEAPLRENLAAGMLDISGWSPGEPLLDPMCGSGTILVEAAMRALNRAPGSRRGFGFERLRGFDPDAWQALREEALRGEEAPRPLDLYGSDLYGDALKAARQNLEAAGLDGCIALKQGNFLEISPPASHGILLTNPPYGVRLGDRAQLEALYPRIGDALKQRFAGWRAWVLTADSQLPKKIRLTPSRRVPLFNGALECRLLEYRIVAGSNRQAAVTAPTAD